MEIACAKLDMQLVECLVMNFQGHFGDRVLSIATRGSDVVDSRMDLLTYLMGRYHWDPKQKAVALHCASEELNIPAVKFLIENGATFKNQQIALLKLQDVLYQEQG